MNWLRYTFRAIFVPLENGLDRLTGPAWNPLNHLGGLGFFFYWIVAVSGIYLYIFFDTGTTAAYQSVEYMTNEQWYLAGVMRSLHRYASDALVLFMVIHIVREFSLDRYRGARWFTWVTGMPIIWLVFAAGITGYWMVWDKLGHYVALVTAEWFDWLPIFGEPIARNFINPAFLESRFFTLLVFMHIILPLVLLGVLWIHLQRVSRPRINPPLGLAIGMFAMFLVLSFVQPATSQGPANLSTVPSRVELDWFYLAAYPLFDLWSNATVWGVAAVLSLMIVVLPLMPPMRRPAPALVDLANCNGCTRCVDDCPFAAVSMGPRTDGQSYQRQAIVSDNLCLSCGLCAGTCPTSLPFKNTREISPGIDLPGHSIDRLRETVDKEAGRLTGKQRIVVFGCERGPGLKGLHNNETATVSLPCVGMLPPSFVDYVLSRGLAEGVVLTGCQPDGCYFRYGIELTEQRLAGTRDPKLRKRVPRDRISTVWAGPGGARALSRAVASFRKSLPAIPDITPPDGPPKAPREYIKAVSDG